jgi:hypothetical protein
MRVNRMSPSKMRTLALLSQNSNSPKNPMLKKLIAMIDTRNMATYSAEFDAGPSYPLLLNQYFITRVVAMRLFGVVTIYFSQ